MPDTNWGVASATLSSITFSILAFAILREWSRRGPTILLFTMAWMTVSFSIVPFLIEMGCSDCANPAFDIPLNSGPERAMAGALILLSVTVFLVVAALAPRPDRVMTKSSIPVSKIRNEDLFAIFASFVGVTFSIGFIQIYGGLTYVLENISQIRSGVDENKNYVGAFLKMFFFYIYFAMAYYLARYRSFKTPRNMLVFGLFLILALFMAYLGGGRMDFINLFVILAVVFILTGARIRMMPAFMLAALALIVVIYGKTIIFQIPKGELVSWDQVLAPDFDFSRVAVEFSHQYLSLLNALVVEEWNFRFFGDYLYWLVKPLKLMGMNIPDSISYFNTWIIIGEWDSNIPPGMVAFGYLSLGTFGIILHSAISSLVVRSIEHILASQGKTAVTISFFALSCAYAPYFVWNSDPALFIQINIPIFILFMIYFILRQIDCLSPYRYGRAKELMTA